MRDLCFLLSGFCAVVWLLPVTSSTRADEDAARAYERPPLALSSEQRERLDRALEPLHAQYDPPERMLRTRFSSPGYHTTLRGGYVHRTRKSLWYAVALLDTGDERHLARAIDVLDRVLALQDTDPESRTYGIWSWFLEEPLSKMSPPDWNWADFCGTALLQVVLDHQGRLPAELAVRVDDAVKHAARSIERRNVGPAYTNIAIMGTYVTLVAAETYRIADLREYALRRLGRFHRYTLENGGFTEYNSPTYTVVALEELGRMRLDVRDPEARSLIEELYVLAWKQIAEHFHPPTRQWAGPHSRSYRTLLSGSVLALLQRATDGRLALGGDGPSIDAHRLPLPCPSDLEPYFTDLPRARDVVRTFARGEPSLVGTTRLEPAFALGSVNRGDMWNQRRALVAYWGTAERPSYLHLRVLHDGYDFAAAQFISAQSGGEVLAAIAFATDGGDTHVSLDRIRNATITVSDLRLRFELGGAAAGVEPSAPTTLDAPARLRFDDVRVELAVPYATFGGEKPCWEAGRDAASDRAWLDVVLYKGAERAIDLSRLDAAAIGLGVRLAVGQGAAPVVAARVSEGHLEMEWGKLGLRVPVRPARARELRRAFSASSPEPNGSPSGEWVGLFNGRDLQGWMIKCRPNDNDKRGYWRVENGTITAETPPGSRHDYIWLLTEKEYGDFELRLKAQSYSSSTGNSGVQVRSRYDDETCWLDGPQVDIHPPGPWRCGFIYDETREARIWLWPDVGKPSNAKPSHAPKGWKWTHADREDVWNDIYIRCRGTQIKTVINGVPVADYDGTGRLDDEHHRRRRVGLKGHIGLQIHPGQQLLIRFKDIEVRALE